MSTAIVVISFLVVWSWAIAYRLGKLHQRDEFERELLRRFPIDTTIKHTR